ncbi:DUF3817 domain-containing protein [Beijerinckia indica]|uniref:DUF3817 domain-containing protein n=1 Tax=Beijerinckia indica subsp. indica (strain ATCC 9039 / DSM 1715 / NCIMB 8712) TaxID=395963 RepID=B2IEB5_BEII9|nr:DUF3817 domain-containing protein [Beijerinckia indica]ACB95513.1 conserved hypothetical protein [Beijerinckia indica subsp. indica ATCC 9039]
MAAPLDKKAEERRDLQLMQWASLLEGTTLVLLVFIAVPLKHLGGCPIATSIMGPIHGLAFLFYVWMMFRLTASADWSKGEMARLLIAALIPFGAFANERILRKKAAEIDATA